MTSSWACPGRSCRRPIGPSRTPSAREAEGFDAVWWPCHLMGWHPDSVWTQDLTPLAAVQPNPHTYFDPLLMMGAVGAATDGIRVGVGGDRPDPPPSRRCWPRPMLTLDHLTGGRAILGLGSGERINITPYGLPFDKPVPGSTRAST